MGAETARWLYVSAVVLYSIVVFMMLTRSIRQGSPVLAALWCWMASPLPLLFVAWRLEQRDIRHLVDPTIQSWAFLFGDFVFLPFMGAMLALAWRRLLVDCEIAGYHNLTAGGPSEFTRMPAPVTPWYAKRWWLALTLVIGFGAGLIFHWVDGVNYTELARNSPAKLLHDIGSYSVLFGALLYGLAVLFVRAGRKLALVALLGFALWFGAVVADNTIHKLDGRNLHIQYDWDNWRSVPY